MYKQTVVHNDAGGVKL